VVSLRPIEALNFSTVDLFGSCAGAAQQRHHRQTMDDPKLILSISFERLSVATSFLSRTTSFLSVTVFWLLVMLKNDVVMLKHDVFMLKYDGTTLK
jgi:hypothetical protein